MPSRIVQLNIQQLTYRHCSVVSMSIMNVTKQQYHRSFHTDPLVRHNGKLLGQHSSTVSVLSIRLFHVSPYLPTCLCWQSSQQTVSSSGPCYSGFMTNDNCAHGPHQYTGIHGVSCISGVHGSLYKSGCNKRGINDTYIATIILYTWVIVTINLWLAQAHLNEQWCN